MPELPTGTVTFFFSDVEGSTRLIQTCGERWPELLGRHQALLRAAFATHGGVELSTEGDSFFAVFPSAPGAVAAAVEAQLALSAEPWPEDGVIRVRIGVHTGEARAAGDTYVGLDVHRAARIMGAGHGGQILLSASTEQLVQQVLPDGVELGDLGEHRLRDLAAPERLYTLRGAGLPDGFPPLRSMETAPNNLPVQLTSFLGRDQELREVSALLADHRLVTLSGPGGTGKTRLGLAVAAAVAMQRFPDGVYFVPLARIREVELVLPTIGQVLGIPEPGRQPRERLGEHIGAQRILLVLDNLEQVTDAAPDVVELLRLAPGLRVLATSRSALRVYGEQEYPVPPLTLPDPRRLAPGTDITRYPAVALFVERARAVQPGFVVTAANAPAVAEICWRLDGLPLAIELAAARVRILSVEAMRARMSRHLDLGAGGARDLPDRQRTLRGAIDWSYDLLDDADRRLFARFSVFAGGADLDAVEAVIEAPDAFDAVASLVDKSLLRRREEGPHGAHRFRMLETIREYAQERLADSGEADALRRRHAAHYSEFAETVATEIVGPRQKEQLDAMGGEHDNIRAAIVATLELGEVELALRLLPACWRFWQMRGHLAEGRERARRILSLPGVDRHPLLLAKAQEAAGGIVYWQGDMEGAQAHYHAALELRRQLGDDAEIANALYNVAMSFGNAMPDEEDGRVEVPDEGKAAAGEALDIYRRLGDRHGEAVTLWCMLDHAILERRVAEVPELGRQCIDIFTELGDRFYLGWTYYMMGLHENIQRRPAEAIPLFVRALELFHESGDLSAYSLVFDGFAAAAFLLGDRERSMRLAGAANAIAVQSGSSLARLNRLWAGFHPERLLDDPQLRAAYEEGRQLLPDDTTELALALSGTVGASSSTAASPAG
ncbi:MAG: ATP-binding protein [Chloroflexota bacterium]